MNEKRRESEFIFLTSCLTALCNQELKTLLQNMELKDSESFSVNNASELIGKLEHFSTFVSSATTNELSSYDTKILLNEVLEYLVFLGASSRVINFCKECISRIFLLEKKAKSIDSNKKAKKFAISVLSADNILKTKKNNRIIN